MIEHVRVENLKSVRDSGLLRFAPLTFLMGPNSSGKSSIIQAILLAKQTVESVDPENPIAMQGDYVQLGSFPELIFKGERTRTLKLEFAFAPIGIPAIRANSIALTTQFSFNRKTYQMYPTSSTYVLPPTDLRVQKTRLSTQASLVEVFRGDTRVFRTRGPHGKFYDLPRFFPMTSQTDARFVVYLPREFERQFRRTYYVGPLRTTPSRAYVAGGETPQGVGLHGEMTLPLLWAARWNPTLRHGVFQPASAWLDRLGIATQLELKRMGGSGFTCLVADPALQVKCNFADIGFGASQVLPAIVQALSAPQHSTVILEQPEIHLHPRAQAILGDLFVTESKKRKQFIIETHSEHLISRVLTRIADGSLPLQQVALFYCSPSSEGTRIDQVSIDDYGRFVQGLPPGFFEQEYEESKAQAEAAARRMQGPEV